MSLEIDVNRVVQVLLSDGKWYQVEDFYLDAYEFSAGFHGGQAKEVVASTGARWTEISPLSGKRTVFCPINAIQAVSYNWKN